MLGASAGSAGRPSPTEARLVWLIAPAAIFAAVIAGLAAAKMPAALFLPFLVLIPIIIWVRPHWSVLIVVLCATTVEQFTYTIGTRPGAFTDKLPLFRTPIHGLIISPVELFILFALFVWIMRSGLRRTLDIPRSPLAACMCVMWLFLIVGLGIGLQHGAQIRDSLWELRPWILLSASYLLAYTMLTTRKALDSVLWAIVLGTGFKGLQGTYIFLAFARGMRPRPEAILGHEEAFFFCVFILLTAGLWLYGMRGRLRTTATWLLPFVLVADLANARRVAWLLIMASLFVLLVIGYATLSRRRRSAIRWLLVGLALFSAAYLPAYWNKDGTLAQPARAIRSAVAPNDRDKSSDLYRTQENVNLLINIKAAGKMGRGFGVPIIYSSTITDISGTDSLITFIPHNGVLWVWLRLGIQGEIAFWCLIAAALIRSCRLARARDRKLAFLGALVSSSIVAYVLMGYNDLGFAWFRIAALMGVLLGTVEAANRFAGAAARKDPMAREPRATKRMAVERPADDDAFAELAPAALES